jgi:predicted phage terminase large subunit-like protein
LDLPPTSFREFVDTVRPGYQWYWHCEKLADILEGVISGDVKRLMIYEPPRHGKSEQVSRLFTAYYLRRFPERWVGLNSYSAELSYSLSRASRNFYRGEGVELSPEAQATKQWETGKGGGLWAAGVGGSITGKGFHLGVIDDPLKNAEDAASETIRTKQRDWYDSTFYTRAEPDAAIILIQTRWHEADLAGYLLDKEYEEPEGWHIIDFAALREDAPIQVYLNGELTALPDTCTLEPDDRKLGKALCPERYDEEALQKIRGHIGSYYFTALYQQRPRPREGNVFKREWFEFVDTVPEKGTTVRYWDKAATEGAGDWTAGVKMRRVDSTYYVLDVRRGQWAPGKRDGNIVQTANEDGKQVRQRTEQEPGASGKDAALAFVTMLQGYSAGATSVTGDKLIRAEPLASQAEAGNVKIVRGTWNRVFLDELTAFDKGKHDDQVDGASGAFNFLAKSVVPVVSPWGPKEKSYWRGA